MNKRIKKKKARRRPFLPRFIEAMERYVNGERHETTRARKRRIQQENKARRQAMNRINYYPIFITTVRNMTDFYSIHFGPKK